MTTGGSGATIRNDTLTGSPGITISAANVSILLNTIGNSATYGIVASPAGSGKAENNRITGNAIGVGAGTAMDLGGGGFMGVGNNILSCNSQFDLYAGAATVNAANNRWDHAPPTVGIVAGVDIAVSTGSVFYAPAFLTVSPCP
jgi:hypothetical protein